MKQQWWQRASSSLFLLFLLAFVVSVTAFLSLPSLQQQQKKHKQKIATTRTIRKNNMEDDKPASAGDVKKKKVIYIRHGRSTANEHFDKPGNRWGDDTFTDDISLRDAPLSDIGKQQAIQLCQHWSQRIGIQQQKQQQLQQHHQQQNENEIEIDLVVVSPLTRALQTYELAVEPNIANVAVLAHPLVSERIYTASDLGRPATILQQQFPNIDFSSQFHSIPPLLDIPITQNQWWYNPSSSLKKQQEEEWRPHNAHQYYACPGEPRALFDQRMKLFRHWLEGRREETIVVVAHWAVIRWFTGEEDVANCDVRIVEFDPDSIFPER